MASPGDVLDQPSGLRATFLRTANSTSGRGFEVEWSVPAGQRLVAIPHRHAGFGEDFRVLAGTGRHWVGRRRALARAGDAWTVPDGAMHIHPANAGGELLVVRQSVDLPQPDWPLLTGVERYFETTFALAQQGKVDRFGRIKNPLQDALSLRELLVPGSWFPYIPKGVQLRLFGALARLARGRGLRAAHEPRWTVKA